MRQLDSYKRYETERWEEKKIESTKYGVKNQRK
jgi:hypothetical protein